MTFFSLTDDLGLLDESVRADPDLSVIAETAEREVLLRFTVDEGTDSTIDHVVYLKGYDDDTPSSSNALLKDALKYAIAKVLNHRLKYKSSNPSIRRVQLADWEIEKMDGGDQDYRWPSGWDTELVEFFSEKRPWYHI